MITTNTEKVSVEDGHTSSRLSMGMIALTVAFLLADFLLLTFASRLHIPGTHWNWSGKVISIAFSCLVLACSPWLRQNVGLRWRQSPGSVRVSLICFLAFLGTGVTLGFINDPRPFSLETLLFQTFIPSIDEELAFRGIALALLERAFGQSPMSCRLRYGWAAFIISVFFGLVHAVSLVDGRIDFNTLFFVITFCFASVAALIRARSGSLLWPVFSHSAWNLSLQVITMIR
jgi:uncharacterized protein